MASYFLQRQPESSSADVPIQHEDQVIETKAEINCGPNFASFHDQLKKIQEDFEDLKNAVISSITLFEISIATLNAKEEHLVRLVKATNNELNGEEDENAINSVVNDTRNKLCTAEEKLKSFLNLLEANLKDRITNYNTVRLSIDGREFVVSRRVLNKFPNSLFGKMLAGEDGDYVHGSDGSYVVQHDGTNFDHILGYLRSGTLSDDVIEQYTESLRADAEFYMLPGLKDRINKYDKVKLSINGREFVVSRRVLNKFPGSLFGKMLAGEEGDYVKRRDGSYVVQHDGTNFDHILGYFRSGTLSDDVIEQHNESLRADAEFYMLPGLKDRINNYDKVKLSINGSEFLVSRRVLNKFPDSLFGKMLAGEEGDYVKRRDGSYVVPHDSRNFDHILGFFISGTLSDYAIEQHNESLLDDAEFYMLPGLKDQINYLTVKLNIDGREFVMSRRVLNKFPDSLFGQMLAGRDGNYVKRSDGSYFVEHDSTNFHHILTYFRSGTLSEDIIEQHAESLLDDAEFYMLPDLKDQINHYTVKLSIDDGEFVVSNRVLNKFPNSLFGWMLAGKACEGYAKRDDGSYFVHHDRTNFHHILAYLSGYLSEDVIVQHAVSFLADAEFYMLPGLKDRINNYTVTLNINDKEFVVSKRVLKKFPESLFGRMLAGENGNYIKRHDGSYFVQRDGTNFHHILTYLRSGILSDDVIKQHNESLLDDAEFYMLAELKLKIKSRKRLLLERRIKRKPVAKKF